MQDEAVVDFDQVLQVVLLQADEAFQVGAMPPGAVETVNDVLLLLLLDEEDVEHLLLALAAIVGRLVLPSPVEPDLNTFGADELKRQLSVP